jgi:hypothetical protein
MPSEASSPRSRLVWTAAGLGIVAILLVCTALVLIAALRS